MTNSGSPATVQTRYAHALLVVRRWTPRHFPETLLLFRVKKRKTSSTVDCQKNGCLSSRDENRPAKADNGGAPFRGTRHEKSPHVPFHITDIDDRVYPGRCGKP